MTNSSNSTEEMFGPKAIRERLPGNISDEQQRSIVAAVRNPDATWAQLGEKTRVMPWNIEISLRSLVKGILGKENSGEWISERGGQRKAESFDELTEKQAVVVDYLAHHPGFDYKQKSSKQLANAVQSWAPDAPQMHETYPKDVAREYAELIETRRKQLAIVEDDTLDYADYDAIGDPFEDCDSPRDYLELAGWTKLPNRNLDKLADHDDAQRFVDDLKSSKSDDESQASPGDYDNETRDFAHTDHLYEVLPTEADKDDVEFGRRYHAVVNNTERWGVFVTLNPSGDWDQEVNGLIHKSKINNLHTPDEFLVDDEVGVMLVERKQNGDLNFEMVAALDTAQGFIWESDPTWAPDGPKTAEVQPAPAEPVGVTQSDVAASIIEDAKASAESVDDSDAKYVCDKCGEKFENRGIYANHVRWNHGDEDESTDAEVGDEAETDTSDSWGETTPAELLALYDDVVGRVDELETRVNTIAEDAVFAHEIKQFGERVEDEIEALRDELNDVSDSITTTEPEPEPEPMTTDTNLSGDLALIVQFLKQLDTEYDDYDWEVKRDGNTAHLDLTATKRNEE